MVILLASYPRSGNTWFRILAHALYGIKSGDCHSPEGTLAERGGIRELQLLIGQSPVAELEAGSGASFLKTHEMADENDQRPAICVVRDGRDVYASYAYYALSCSPVSSGTDYLSQLRAMVQSPDFFGGWSRNVESWLARKSPTAFVRYEDLLANPEKCVRDTMATFGVKAPTTVQRPLEFDELKKLVPTFFRKGQAGSWRDDMTPEIEDIFWVHHGATMERLGYAR